LAESITAFSHREDTGSTPKYVKCVSGKGKWSTLISVKNNEIAGELLFEVETDVEVSKKNKKDIDI